MFIVALFTIAKTWRQPKCPSTDESIKNMRYIPTSLYKYIDIGIDTHTHTHTHYGILLSHKKE